jgi:hypothetical protein
MLIVILLAPLSQYSCHIDEIALNTITLTMMYIKWDSIDQYVQVNRITIRLNNNVLEE